MAHGDRLAGFARPGPSEDGRKAILDAAARLFARKGYLATSIDAIADELGATKGRVYHYYRGKAEIFLDVVVTGMHDLIAALEPVSRAPDVGPAEKTRRMAHLHASLMMVRNYPQRVAVQAVDNRRIPEIAVQVEALDEVFELRRRYERMFVEVVEQGIAAGDFMPQDSVLAARAALGSLNWIPIWFSPERSSEADTERVAAFFANFVVCGLTGDAQTTSPGSPPTRGETQPG